MLNFEETCNLFYTFGFIKKQYDPKKGSSSNAVPTTAATEENLQTEGNKDKEKAEKEKEKAEKEKEKAEQLREQIMNETLRNAWKFLTDGNEKTERVDSNQLLIFCAAVLGLYTGENEEVAEVQPEPKPEPKVEPPKEPEPIKEENDRQESNRDTSDQAFKPSVEPRYLDIDKNYLSSGKKPSEKNTDRTTNNLKKPQPTIKSDRDKKKPEKKDKKDNNEKKDKDKNKKPTTANKNDKKAKPSKSKSKSKIRGKNEKPKTPEYSEKDFFNRKGSYSPATKGGWLNREKYKPPKRQSVSPPKGISEALNSGKKRKRLGKNELSKHSNMTGKVAPDSPKAKGEEKPLIKQVKPEFDLKSYNYHSKTTKHINNIFREFSLNRFNFILEAKNKAKNQKEATDEKERTGKKINEKDKHKTQVIVDHWRRKCFDVILNP